MAKRPLKALALPEPTLATHSAFKVSASGVRRWLATLPRANRNELLRQLHDALSELNRVRCSPRHRFAALEVLRPVIHETKQGVHKLYLNKPAKLPEEARKAVELCHVFNQQMATGYGLVASEIAARFYPLGRGELATSIHRALTEYCRVLLRQYQLYSTPGPGFWLSLHQLYELALATSVNRKKVHDPQFGDGRVQQAYLRTVMLATIPPNQLSQHELSTVFHYLNEWTPKLKLTTEPKGCVFLWSLNADRPPVYRELAKADGNSLGVNTVDMLNHLAMLARVAGERREEYIEVPDLHRVLINHLIDVWRGMPPRQHRRHEEHGTIRVCLGLFATHYFISGRTPFRAYHHASDISSELKYNSELSKKARDVWSQSLSHDTLQKEAGIDGDVEHLAVETIDYTEATQPAGSRQEKSGYSIYEVSLVDRSEGGYCVRWPTAETVRMQAGDVVGVQSAENGAWELGILRWISHVESDISHIGIESLAAAAEAYSARLVQLGIAIGHPYRALLIAPAPDHSQHCLLLPRGIFMAGHTLELMQPSGRCLYPRLSHSVVSTSAFNLFEVALEKP